MKEKDLKLGLKEATKKKDVDMKQAIRMVLGEIPRLNKKKGELVTEDDINNIITKLIKSELMVLEYSGIDESKSRYLEILKSFLPTMMTEEEIIDWVLDNIDLDAYIDKVKAMGPIMKELKGRADGNIVRRLLQRNI